MKKIFFYILFIVLIASCKDDDVNVFDKSADERAAEAVNSLKEKLTSSADGWLVKYTPSAFGAGSFYVLMTFNDDYTVNIKSDLGANDGTYFDQTITYRIDNSLGIELILESYSFFAYLYELDQATFPAEYEFVYVNETEEGNLVFTSKSDITADKTTLVFQPATSSSSEFLGTTLATNLNVMSDELEKFTSSLSLTYENKDLILYLSMDEARRVLTITSASKVSNINTTAVVGHTTPYLISGDSIILDEPLSRTILGIQVSISSLILTSTFTSSINECDSPISITGLAGKTSQNDNVKLQSSMNDAAGKTFTQADFYFSPNYYIFQEGVSMEEQILTDLPGALAMQLYYNYNNSGFYAIGFVFENSDGEITFALREFTPVLNNNNLIFQFEDEISIIGPPPDANVENINIYLDYLTAGDKTFVFQIQPGVYEFYNPCTKWSFVFVDANG
jgi:hypothetical protein